MELKSALGLSLSRRDSVKLLNNTPGDKVMISISGNTITMISLGEPLSTTVMAYESLGGEGIGAIATHPTEPIFVVGINGSTPHLKFFRFTSYDTPVTLLCDVNAADYPETFSERNISCLSFNHTGSLLACIAGTPDFMFTVWGLTGLIPSIHEAETDGASVKLVHRVKAFSQEVYRVAFSDYVRDGPEEGSQALVTGGLGHIRFWQMASTFTGEKLLGKVGKFGALDISDTSGFVICPDEAVISGTEGGDVALWSGDQTIKLVLALSVDGDSHTPVHDGPVEVVQILNRKRDGTDTPTDPTVPGVKLPLGVESGDHILLTAAHDGTIRLWDLDTISLADPEGLFLIIQPLATIHVASPAQISSVTVLDSTYLIHDITGRVLETDVMDVRGSRATRCLLESHAGDVLLSIDPSGLVASGCGAGRLMVHAAVPTDDEPHRQCELITTETFNTPADPASGALALPNPITSLSWAPTDAFLDVAGPHLLVGHEDGQLRLMTMSDSRRGQGLAMACNSTAVTAGVLRPHAGSVIDMCFIKGQNQLATISSDGTLFIFESSPDPTDPTRPALEPVGYITLPPVHDAPYRILSPEAGGVMGREFIHVVGKAGTVWSVDVGRSIPSVADERHRKTFDLLAGLSEPDAKDVVTTSTIALPHVDLPLLDKKAVVGRLLEQEKKRVAAERQAAIGDKRFAALEEEEELDIDALTTAIQAEPDTPPPFTVKDARWRSGFGFDLTVAVSESPGEFGKSELSAARAAVRSSVVYALDMRPARAIGPDSTQPAEPAIITATVPEDIAELKAVTIQTTPTPAPIHPAAITRMTSGENRFIVVLPSGDVGVQSAGVLTTSPAHSKGFPVTSCAAGSDGVCMTMLTADASGAVMVTGTSEPAPSEISLPASGPSFTEKDWTAPPAPKDEEEVGLTLQAALERRNMSERERAAERIKAETIRAVERLRARFKEATEHDSHLTPAPATEGAMDVDPSMRDIVADEEAAHIAQAQAEARWHLEHARLHMTKVLDATADLECDARTLRSFNMESSVGSFRLHRLAPETSAALDELGCDDVDGDEADDEADESTDDTTESRPSTAVPSEGATSRQATPVPEALSKVEERKARRAERKAKMDRLLAEEPKDGTHDPDDVAAIENARVNTGTWPLKTSAEYVVPEGERVDTTAKRRQLLLLERSVHDIKSEFNASFIETLKMKHSIVHAAEEARAQLEAMRGVAHAVVDIAPSLADTAAALSTLPDELGPLVLHSDEVSPDPTVAPGRITVITLKTKLKEIRRAEVIAERKKAASTAGGFGGLKKTVEEGAEEVTDADLGNLTTPWDHLPDDTELDAVTMTVVDRADAGTHPTHPTPRLPAFIPPADRALIINNMLLVRQRLVADIIARAQAFDVVVHRLHCDRARLTADLTQATMTALRLHQEVALLQEFERADRTLNERLAKERSSQSDIQTELAELAERLQSRTAEADDIAAREAALNERLEDLIGTGETGQYADTLRKLFNKRVTKYDDGESESEDYDNIGDSDLDLSDSDVEIICPPGCSAELFDQVSDLRLERSALADEKAAMLTFAHGLNTKRNGLLKQEKLAVTNIAKTLDEINRFQTEKLAKLNVLPAAVPLQLSQVFLDPAQLATENFESVTIFPGDGINILQSRIVGHKARIAELKREGVALGKERGQLTKELQRLAMTLESEEERKLAGQMLKFGRKVDLERLDSLSINDKAIAIQRTIAETRARAKQREEELRAQLIHAKDELTATRARNTVVLKEQGELTDTSHQMEGTLRKMEQKPAGGFDSSHKQDMIDIKRLRSQLVQATDETEHLRAEINVLSRKSGYLYTQADQ